VQLAFGGGTIALTPIEVATGYAAFANGGYKVDPYLIAEVDSINDDILFKAEPPTVCESSSSSIDASDGEICNGLPQAKRIIEPRVAYVMDSILLDVVNRGTGTKARRLLKRSDLRGKTGTTNDADIWFSGYTPDLVATAWTGFDNNDPVGSREWGSTTPLETWIEYMRVALPKPENATSIPIPDNLVTVKIDPVTGLRTQTTDPQGIFEIFRAELAPDLPPALAKKEETQDQLQQLF